MPADAQLSPDFQRRVLFALALAVLALLAYWLRDLLILLFGAVVVAAVFNALATLLRHHARVPARVSVLAALLLVALALALGGWAVGDALAEQFGALRARFPAAVRALQDWLGSHRAGLVLLDYLRDWPSDGPPWDSLAGFAGLAFGALGGAVLTLVIGVYLATAPALYRDGLVRLLPLSQRDRVRAALLAAGLALRRWLLGQSLSMLFIGLTTGVGLWLLGIPLAPALGLIAGLFAFVPFFGALAAGALAVLLAFVEGPTAALHVALLFLAIQQVEEYLLLPFVQNWAVHLPPVLGLLAAVAFGTLFGPLGLLFATPLAVVVMVLVQRLYVQDVLERGGASILRQAQDSARTEPGAA